MSNKSSLQLFILEILWNKQFVICLIKGDRPSANPHVMSLEKLSKQASAKGSTANKNLLVT